MHEHDPAVAEDHPKPEGRIRKLARVGAYLGTVAIVAGALAARSAYGGMKDTALEIGDELDKLGDIGSETPIWLNGQPIHVGSSVHALSVTETLDLAEDLCRRGTAKLDGAQAAVVPDSDQLLLDTGGEPAMGVVRQERDGRGVVLCFAPVEGQPPPDGIRDRLGRVMSFMATGDLDAIGRLRYLYAKQTDTGGTHLIRVWTDAPFNLYAMTGVETGDAPGSDPADVPRPPESRRLLSATVETAPYAVRVYQSRATLENVAASYDRMMPEQGWQLAVSDGHARVYTRRDMSVFVTPSESENGVLVSMLHMGSDN